MSLLAFVVQTAALVVAVAGLLKAIDPAPVGRALHAAGLPSHPVVGRALGAVEVGVGAWVLVGGGRLAAAALAALYAGFLAFIASNRLRGLSVPCGCLGETTRPPGPAHWVIDGIGVSAALVAVWSPVGPATEWLDDGLVGLLALAGVVAAAAAAVVAMDRVGRHQR